MILMPANNSGGEVHHLAGKYPGKLGHLYSPGGERGPYPWLPYALDNGAFACFTRRKPFDMGAWRSLLAWSVASAIRPRWVLVPDAVGDRDLTLHLWRLCSPEAAEVGQLAFAAQDGMSFDDVPQAAAVVFLGGTTEWKRQAIGPWCARFPRVHVGRVNTYKWLRHCEDAGAESVDGTGWMRGDQTQLEGLRQWLRETSGESPRAIQTSTCFDDTDDEMAHGSKSSATAAPAPHGEGRH